VKVVFRSESKPLGYAEVNLHIWRGFVQANVDAAVKLEIIANRPSPDLHARQQMRAPCSLFHLGVPCQ
jgi:hypothetical protein